MSFLNSIYALRKYGGQAILELLSSACVMVTPANFRNEAKKAETGGAFMWKNSITATDV